MRLFCLFAVVLFGSVAQAQSITVTGTVRITKAQSPFRFSSITIMTGKLIVDPGVVLEATSESARISLAMQANSALEAVGTPDQPIVFAPAAGIASWRGITNTERVSSRPNIKLHNVIMVQTQIDLGSANVDFWNVDMTSPKTFGTVASRGFSLRNNSIGSLVNCTIDGSTTGFSFPANTMIFENCEAINCTTAIGSTSRPVVFSAMVR
jgi:hypothetical protein